LTDYFKLKCYQLKKYRWLERSIFYKIYKTRENT
jgi:hypothetical protein